MIQTIELGLASCIIENEKEWHEVLQDTVNACNIRTASGELSPGRLMYGIRPPHFRKHVRARSEVVNFTDEIVDFGDENALLDRHVWTVTLMSLRATRFIPWDPSY